MYKTSDLETVVTTGMVQAIVAIKHGELCAEGWSGV